MYRTILVPLDGSPFGERAIPLALRIARHTGAAVELVHVHDQNFFSGGGAPTIDRRLDLEVQHGMRTALDRLRERIAASTGVPVTSSFLLGAVVPTLQAHVETRGVDLVVMTTHGRGGVSRAWLGSIADALVRHLYVPVLLGRQRTVGRAAAAADAPAFRRTLVPLDGSAFAEDVLAHAVALGVSTQTEYLLVRVVSLFPMLPVLYPDGAIPVDPAVSDGLAREAEHYLATVAAQLRGAGVGVSTRVVVHRQPARAILESARDWNADLIALASHGHGALGRLVLGSVADKVIRGATVPTLVYRSRVPTPVG